MRIEHYDRAGGREALLRFGPEAAPTVLALLPLLEEANRTRAFVVTILRALAAHGIAGALPDLPGTGDSLVPTGRMTLADLRAAAAAAAVKLSGPTVTLGLRSGALLDAGAAPAARWLLSPQTGDEVLREWTRTTRAAMREGGSGDTVAGNRVSPDLRTALAGIDAAHPAPTRIVRLGGDPRPADATIPGSPPWRRAEPDNDIALAHRLAADIAAWIARCAG